MASNWSYNESNQDDKFKQKILKKPRKGLGPFVTESSS